MVGVELSILFVLSVVFSLTYELYTETYLGIFAHFSWWVFAMYWLVASDSKVYVVSLLFWAIGLIYMLRWLFQVWDVRKAVKYGEEE